ncbi:alpha/beta fold hydrolase [Nibrella saemangeumensis]|uniref:Alpha/beta fold hydrolase n=1 Tax=Nibrella saemangeumensis TaxID=1084526 RepID=A0ABP8MBA4_9BACT
MKTLIALLAGLLVTSLTYGGQTPEKTFYFTTSDSTRLYVRMAGQGEPCLFLHGGPGSTSHYFEASGGHNVEAFMRMIYIDLRGSGRSGSAPSADYSIARLEKDLEELRQYLGLDNWSVMGHSFAGLLMTNYGAHHKAHVRSMIYVNTTLDLPRSAESWIDFGIRELKIADTKPYKDPAVPVMERMGRISQQLEENKVWYKLMFKTPQAKALSDSVSFKAIPNFNGEYGMKVWGNGEYMQDMTPLTAQISVPVLVIAGAQDYAVGPTHYTAFRFPKARLVIYEGGHAPYQESPDWFIENVRKFIRKQPVGVSLL